MKKCPKCGALMEKNVNFCTKCGADLRNVDLGQETKQTNTEPAKVEIAPVEEVQTQIPSTGRFQHYWQWLVESWQKPAQNNLPTESWYGWVTILVEDLLFILGLYFLAKALITGAIGLASSFGVSTRGWGNYDLSFNIVFRVFIIILVFEAIIILAHFAAYKFVYNGHPNLFAFVNTSTHASNLNLILTAIFFLLMLLGLNSIRFSLFLILLMIVIFFIGQEVTLLAHEGAVRDKVYGMLIAFGIIFVCTIIVNSIIYNSVLRVIINEFMSGINGAM